MRGPPVVLTNTLGRPVTNVISERGAVPMTVVNTLGEPVTLVAQGGEPVTLFNPNGTLWDYPFSLFANNEQGAWYDPSDYSTLYQDAAGTTPVTAVEQPVRLMLDRSKGLVLGPELVTNGTFDTNLNGWTLSGTNLPTWSASGIVLTSDGSFFSRARQSFTTIVGLTYRLTFDVVTPAGSLNVKIGTSAGASNVLASGSLTSSGARSYVFFAQSTTTHIELENGSTAAPVLDNISIKALPGNHATAPNDASRPVLRARYNLLTQSDDLTSYSITPATGLTSTLNATTAPTGAATARRLTNTATTEFHRLFQGVTLTSGAEYTYTVYLKSDTAGWAQMSFFRGSTTAFANINLATGALGTTGGGTSYSVTSVGNGWYRLSVTATTEAAGCNLQLYVLEADSVTANPSTTGTVKSIFVWGAQLLTSADQTATGGAYQRIAAATDYDTSNPVWRPYLAFDGSDDSLSTSAIDFSGTDEMTVFAGVSKLSDAALAILLELSANTNSNNGSFWIGAPISGGAAHYDYNNKGTAAVAVTAITYAAPITNVVTTQSDISAPRVAIRVDGIEKAANNAASQGTGNFGNYPLFIGRRNNTSFPLNGRLYSLAVLGRTATTAEIGAMEAWVAGKTGVTI